MRNKTILKISETTQKLKLEPLIKQTMTFDVNDSVSNILYELGNNRSEAFTMKNNSCYFINNRTILDKKKINESMKIASIIKPISNLEKTDNIGKAIEIFLDHKVDAIPILQNKKIIGEIQILSIMKHMMKTDLENMLVSQIKTKKFSISPEKPISAARKKFREDKIDVLPVKNDSKVKQVITSGNIVSILNPPEKVGKRGTIGKKKIRSLESQISNVGTSLFPRCNVSSSLKYAVQEMLKQNTSYCLVDMPSGKYGILTAHDIINIYRQKPQRKIPIQVIGDKDNEISTKLSKMETTLNKFSKIVENVLEARLYLSKQKTTGRETEYHIDFLIVSAKNKISLSTKAWSVEEGISNLANKISEKILPKNKRRIRKTIRKTSKTEILAKNAP